MLEVCEVCVNDNNNNNDHFCSAVSHCPTDKGEYIAFYKIKKKNGLKPLFLKLLYSYNIVFLARHNCTHTYTQAYRRNATRSEGKLWRQVRNHLAVILFVEVSWMGWGEWKKSRQCADMWWHCVKPCFPLCSNCLGYSRARMQMIFRLQTDWSKTWSKRWVAGDDHYIVYISFV